MKPSLSVLGFVFAASLASAQAPADASVDAAWQAWNDAVAQEMVTGTEPRAWALAAFSSRGGNVAVADGAAADVLLQRALVEAPDDTLAQWLAAQHYLAHNQNAKAAHSGDALTRLEPDNGASWLPALALAARADDEMAFDAALAHMAAATRHDTHFAEVLRVWMDAYEHVPTPSPDLPGVYSGAPAFTAAMAYAQAMAIPGYRPLMAACRPQNETPLPARRLEQCTAIGRLLLHRGTTIVDRSVGAGLLRHVGDAALDTADSAMVRRLAWQLQQAAMLAREEDPATLRGYANDWRRLDDEMAIHARALARAGLPTEPPPGWMPPRGWSMP